MGSFTLGSWIWGNPKIAVALRPLGHGDNAPCKLRGRRMTIGRDRRNDIVIDQPFVSAEHARIEIRGRDCVLIDLGSTNGTWLNGQKVGVHGRENAVALRHGDRLRFDTVEYEALIEGIEGPLSEPAPAAVRPLRVLCGACHEFDLSAIADSDGRARELADVARYRCTRCLPPRAKPERDFVGRYELLHVLGRGGIGTVHLVYDEGTGRLWALKLMNQGNPRDIEGRFYRGERAHQELAHRNVVRWVDQGRDHKRGAYVVSEYVEGDQLGHCALGSTVIKPGVAVPLMCAVLEGLRHLHERGIMHRDLKPENILLDRPLFSPSGTVSSPLPTPKIADFDLARQLGLEATVVTHSNISMGTLQYMPPEQVLDAKRADKRSDIYAAGVILYYLLTGRFSFDFPPPREVLEKQRPTGSPDMSDSSLIKAIQQYERQLERALNRTMIIVKEEPIPIRERNPSIPAKLAHVIDRAVCKNPDERFQAASTFREALEQAT